MLHIWSSLAFIAYVKLVDLVLNDNVLTTQVDKSAFGSSWKNISITFTWALCAWALRQRMSIVASESCWTSQERTNVNRGQQNAAATLARCKTACVDNTRCTGVDYIPSNPARQRCWLSGSWSGTRNNGTAPSGVTHHDLDRNCLGWILITFM